MSKTISPEGAAELAYTAYCVSGGEVNEDPPLWADLGPMARNGWIAAADVLRKLHTGQLDPAAPGRGHCTMCGDPHEDCLLGPISG